MSIEIKNIIFDLGGVLLNIDYALTIKAFEAQGIPNFEEEYSQAKQTDLFDKFETGRITENEFIEGITSLIGKGIQKNQVLQAWNAMLLDFPKERLNLLHEVGKQYRIFLLSNTNETHITAFEKIIEDQHQLSSLDSLFEKAYYSNRIGLRKPDTSCFDFVINENQLNKSETVFFDDSIQHIHGASAAGIPAVFVDKSKTILDYFTEDYKLKHLLL